MTTTVSQRVETFDVSGIVMDRSVDNILRVLKFVLPSTQGVVSTWVHPEAGYCISSVRPVEGDEEIEFSSHLVDDDSLLDLATQIHDWLAGLGRNEAQKLNASMPMEASSRTSLLGFGLHTRYRRRATDQLVFEFRPAWVWPQQD